MLKANYKRDYFTEAHQILNSQGYRSYIQQLLPGGKVQNNEYIVKNPTRNDNKAGSFCINITTGKWSDFATGDAGNDLIGLTTYVKGISKIEACFYIGVPRSDKNRTNNVSESGFNVYRETEEEVEIEYTTEEIEEYIASFNEDIERELAEEEQQTSTITTTDIEQQYTHAVVPEFSEEFIGRKTKDRFKGGTLTFYRYYSSKGIPVGCVVRCDKDIDGDKAKSFAQFSYDRIKNRWQPSWRGDGKPLYNLQEITARLDVPVMVVEGEKTAEAAKLLFPEYVVTTSCMGSASARSSNWSCLSGRDVIIARDNDLTGSRYAKTLNDILIKQETKSINGLSPFKLGSYIIVDGKPTKREHGTPEKYDLADSLADGWTAELINEWKNHEDFSPFFEATKDVIALGEELKDGDKIIYLKGQRYKLNYKNNILYYEKEEKNESGDLVKSWKELCGYIKPTHCTEDINGDHGVLVQIVTRKNKFVECFFAREEIATEKDTIKLLLRKGLSIPHLRDGLCYAINYYLNNYEPEFKAVGVDMVGWQGDNTAYTLPFVGEPRNCYNTKQARENPVEYILQQKTAAPRILKKKGTLDEWKRTVGEVCRGNHLHTFAILVSLAAPALKLLGEEGGFFHYVGSTSIGKSTILNVAKSVWGFKDLGSFRATDNNLESICKNSNDGAMFLDEMGEVNADDLFKIIYMLANGVTKGRADKNGNAKETSHFTVLAQSTGEIGLEAKLAEKKLQVKGGQLIRMAEIDADRGKGLNTFDVLNITPDTKAPFTSGREQAEFLKTYADQNYGIVIDEFMKKIVTDIEDYKTELKKAKAKWLARKLTGEEGVEVARMAKRFSTIFATGVIALELGIIPHSFPEIENCIDEVFKNWLNRFGGNSSHEFRMIIADLRKLCIEQKNSRFQNTHPTEDEKVSLPYNKAGYWKMEQITDKDQKTLIWVVSEFWMYPQVFEREVLKGRDKNVFLPLLVEEGYIIKEEKDRYQCKRRPAKENSQWFIVVLASVFSSESE
jgi:uncharacterized protein (DUF927 family)